ncbi:MAG: tape measure protein [Chlorobiaceae bacterium]|nr:tape measure protein [Chlorobiaceae bacterium]
MGKSVGNLYVSLGLNTTPFAKGMHDAQSKLRHFEAASKAGSSAFAGITGNINLTSAALGQFNRMLTAGALAYGVKQLIDISDKYTQLDGRLRLVTKSTEEFQSAQSGLYAIAQGTRVEYAATVDLYTRLARSTDQLGISQGDLLQITESINKAMIVSGASGESAAAALMQLGQGMASGVLRGEELNSIMEQTPRLAQMIADGMGITIGQLRQYGKDGKLSADAVTKALLSQTQTINGEFARMPETVGQAMTKLTNVVESIVNQSNNAAGATSSLSGAIDQIGVTLDQNRDGIINSFIAIANAVNWTAKRVAALGNAVALFNQMRAGKVSVGEWVTADDTEARRLLARSTGTGYGATGSWGAPESPSKPAATANAIVAPGNGAKSGSGGGAADKQKDRIDALRTSLMTERELEDQRYADGAKALSEYYGKSGELTAEGNELAMKLAEDHQKKMDEINGVTKWQRDLEALQERFKIESELEQERYDEQMKALEDQLANKEILESDYMARKEEAELAHLQSLAQIAEQRSQKEAQVEQSIRDMRMQTASMAINLMTMVAGKSKAAALAAIALNKGLMIAQTIQNTAAAKMRAMAELGPIAGPPAAAAIATMGAIQVGLIAASGLAEAASAAGSSGESISASSNSTSYSSGSDGSTSAATTTSNRTVTIYGLNKDSLYSGEQVAELLNDYMADGGKLYIK